MAARAPEPFLVADELVTGEAVALDLRPTGFALRAAGAILDYLVSTAVYIGAVFGIIWLAIQTEPEFAVVVSELAIAFVLSYVVLPAAVEVSTKGRSVGRFATGARIVRDDGGAIGVRHAAVRALVGVLEFAMTLGGLAAIVGLLAPRTKRLGDLLAGTYSQYERVSRREVPPFGMPVPLRAWAGVADVGRLPDPLALRITRFLRQAGAIDPQRRFWLAQQLAAEAAPYVSPIPAVDPELLLAGIAVLRREREEQALRLERARLERLRPALDGLPHAFPARGR